MDMVFTCVTFNCTSAPMSPTHLDLLIPPTQYLENPLTCIYPLENPSAKERIRGIVLSCMRTPKDIYIYIYIYKCTYSSTYAPVHCCFLVSLFAHSYLLTIHLHTLFLISWHLIGLAYLFLFAPFFFLPRLELTRNER